MTKNGAIASEFAAADLTGSPAIEVAHLVKLYKTTRAVDGVSFRIARGSITGLLGGNGAGKTTTIAMIMGLVLPTSGRIRVLDHSIPEESAAVLGRMNFESPYVDMPMRLTVRQNLTRLRTCASASNSSLPISISAISSTAPTENSPPGRRRAWRWQRR
jgi:ABC-2 type transport system ATP-binding protein